MQELQARGKTPEEYNHDPIRASVELEVPLERRDTVMNMLDLSSTTITRHIRDMGGVSRGGGCYLFAPGDIDQLRKMKRRPDARRWRYPGGLERYRPGWPHGVNEGSTVRLPGYGQVLIDQGADIEARIRRILRR